MFFELNEPIRAFQKKMARRNIFGRKTVPAGNELVPYFRHTAGNGLRCK